MVHYLKFINIQCICLTIIMSTIIIILIRYENIIDMHFIPKQVSLINSCNKNTHQNMKYILQFHSTRERKLCLDIQFTGCEYPSCYFTNDIKLMPIDEFDAILFHEPTEYSRNIKLLTKRSLNQKYIFFNHESPVRFPIVFKKNFYNLTITYRRDADVYFSYERVERREEEKIINKTILMEQIKNKTKLISWVVSNCHSYGVQDRMKLYEQLKKYIPIDVYGSCGNFTCPGRMSTDCYQLLDQNYKFYLAFENSYCRDYLTEKMFNILRLTNIVPIVFGNNDYKTLAPPNSVINVEDFKSAKELVDYLEFLDENDEEYMKYFEWKRHYWINHALYKEMCCNMCKKLHEPLKFVWYEDMEKWSLGENRSVCPRFQNKWID